MSDQNPLAKSLQLLWDGVPDPGKGPKPKLTLEQIVTAGIELADTEGFDALSMRRLAEQLGVGTMSLYRYVPSKQELMDLMLDAVATPTHVRADAPSQGWRDFLTSSAHSRRHLYLKHPWALQANWTRPVMGPNSVGNLDLFFSGVKELPLSDQKKMSLDTALDSYIMGSVRQELLWVSAAADSDMTDQEFWSHQHPTLEKAIASGRFPNMVTLDEDTFNGNWDENFELGLQLILDGLETHIDQSPF